MSAAAGASGGEGAALRRRAGLAIGVGLALGAAARFSGLHAQSLWLDEFLAFFIGQQPWDLLIERAVRVHGQSPLYYVLLRPWSDLFGHGDAVVIRALSATLGVVSLVQLAYFARRHLGASRAVVALWLAALSPYQIYMSQEARMYPLLTCLVLGHAQLVMSLLADPHRRRPWGRLLALLGVTVAALYTHYFGALYVASVDLYVLWRRPGRERRFLEIAATQLAAGLLYLPWLGPLMAAAGSGDSGFLHHLELKGLYTAFVFALGYSSVVVDAEAKLDLVGHFMAHAPKIAVAGLAFGSLSLWGLADLSRRNKVLAVLVLLILLVPVLIATAVSFAVPVITERYFAPGLPFFALLLAGGVVTARSWPRRAVVVLVAALVFESLFTYYRDPRFGHEDWRAAADAIEAHPASQAELIFAPEFIDACLAFYLREPRALHTPMEQAQVDALPADRPYWLVVSHAVGRDARLRAWLGPRFEVAERRHLTRGEGIELVLYRPRIAQRTGALSYPDEARAPAVAGPGPGELP